MPYLIRTKSEIFLCTDEGYIYREGKCATSPSPQWRLVRLLRRNNFGHIVESHEFIYPKFKERIRFREWLYKNGKPRYTIGDYDHGTYREWGERVLEVQYVEKL